MSNDRDNQSKIVDFGFWIVVFQSAIGTLKSAMAGFARSPKGLALLGVIVLIGLALWLIPKRVERFVMVDRTGAWSKNAAPPRRQIVWQPPKRIEELLPDLPTETELISPSLTDHGATLYFAARMQGGWSAPSGQADLYRSRFIDGNWSPAEAVKELNTPSDEIGPAFSRDGRDVCFYSNRPGGQGGYDLYHSRRTRLGWQPPNNLGPKINTPAHEYDPAISPDGRTLFFSSNRTAEMALRTASGETASMPWHTTLRASPARPTFDLYAAGRDAANADWKPAEPLTELNRSDSNEGAPFVSPNGAFLYFASDRPVRPGEPSGTDHPLGADHPPNLDLYRARRHVDRLGRTIRFGDPENLGTEINTAAHETEPALSPEGFTLVFSSNQSGSDRLYVSAATEVIEETAWDVSRLEALQAIWWRALLLTLLLAAFAAALLHFRGRLFNRVWSTRFFLGSILVHVLLVLLLGYWTLPAVVHIIVTELQNYDPSTQLFDDNQHQSHSDGREAYEKVADLRSVDTVSIPDLIRFETQPFSVPQRTENPLPTVPMDVARRLPPERVLFVPRPKRDTIGKLGQLARRSLRPAAPVEIAEATEPPLPAAVEPPAETRVERTVELNRRQTAAPKQTLMLQSSPDTEVAMNRPSEFEIEAPVAQPTLQSTPRAIPIKRTDGSVPRNAETPTEDVLISAPVKTPEEREFTPALATVSRMALTPTKTARATPDLPKLETAVRQDAPLDDKPDEPRLDLEQLRPRLTRRIDRASSPRENADPATESEMESDIELAATKPPGEPPLALLDVRWSRSDAQSPAVEVRTPQQLSGPVSRLKHRLIVGTLSNERYEASPSFSPLASRLNRRRAEATRVALAADNVGLRSMFTLREGDTRKQYIELFGGTQESEKAVNRGLEWLAAHQNKDGSWSLHNFHENCKGKHPECSGHGSQRSNSAATGMALLPFLAAGHTHQSGKYQPNVSAALNWFTGHQKKNGDLLAAGDTQPMYSHGIAAIALCEAYGMTEDPKLKAAAQKSLDFIVQAQHSGTGGWRYNPNQAADTSVVGWQMMALKSGQMAGLAVPQKTLDHVGRWLASVEGNQPVGGVFGYQNRSATPAMTAEGLLCLQFMGSTSRNDPRMLAGADFLLSRLPRKDQKNTSYYWYYATQVMYHMQGKYWESWNESLRDQLVATQVKTGQLAGTWDPRDQWEKRGGRVYSSSLKLLILEVYYRHLPLYEQLED